ncbi:hypothetical protein [Mycobacterium sp.]|uniref:hypothetical protein n=1 Tax=Mycobacterium sp. TaxID=1785 RepID=UPI0031E192A9
MDITDEQFNIYINKINEKKSSLLSVNESLLNELFSSLVETINQYHSELKNKKIEIERLQEKLKENEK